MAPVGGLVLGLLVFAAAKDALLGWSARVGSRWEALLGQGQAAFDRYIEAPALAAVAAVDGPAVGAGEGRLGLSLFGFGRDLRRLGLGAPRLPLLFLLAVAVAALAAAGLAASGLPR